MYRISLTLIVLALAQLASAQNPARKPNLVYIVADDLGYADIGAQGLSKDVKTPNVDSIASNGVRFTQGYVTCPVCSPTRAALMTGRYQTRFGHEFNPGPNEAENFGLPTDQVTLPQVLKDAGYATGMVGKWHLGFRPEMHPTKRGFDEFFGFLAGAHGYNDVGQGKNALMRGTTPADSTDYLTDAFGREASAFVEKHAKGDKPFFLYLAFNAIHSPMQAPPKYMERFASTTDPKRQTMLAMLSAMDDAVGQVLGKLREHKLEENTIVVFHADNGGPTQGNGSRNDPLRGRKGEVYEGGVRVPFLAQWKGKVPAGAECENPVVSIDIFPTVVAAANIEAPKAVKLDGMNLLQLLDQNSEAATAKRSLFWKFGPQWAVREGDLKLVHTNQGGTELFDLSKDVGEAKNLATEQPETVKRLQASYDAWNAQNEKPRWRDTRDGKRAGRRGAGRAGAATAPAAAE